MLTKAISLLLQTVFVVDFCMLSSCFELQNLSWGNPLRVLGMTADLRAKVEHAVLPQTPNLVCFCTPCNNLVRGTCQAALDFGALLTTVCSSWPKDQLGCF